MTTPYTPYTAGNDSTENSAEILPRTEQADTPPVGPAVERQPLTSELLPGASGQVPPVPPAHPGPVQMAANPVALPQSAASSQVGSAVIPPSTAEDVDLIEKEWVHRAKALVAKTKDNPHEQNKEMSKYKADYIKKRYNKEIKVSEG